MARLEVLPLALEALTSRHTNPSRLVQVRRVCRALLTPSCFSPIHNTPATAPQVLCASADAALGHALPGGDGHADRDAPRRAELRSVAFQALAYNTPDFLMLQGIVNGTAAAAAGGGSGGGGGGGGSGGGARAKAAGRGSSRVSPDHLDNASPRCPFAPPGNASFGWRAPHIQAHQPSVTTPRAAAAVGHMAPPASPWSW